MLQRAVALSFVVAVILGLQVGAVAVDEAPPAGRASLAIAGAVDHPADLTVDDLRKLPATTDSVFFHTDHGAASGVYTGVGLWGLLQRAGIKADPAIRNETLHKYLVAAGSDGYYAVLALAEINPEFGGDQVIVAYEQDGKPLADGGVRLIVPGDKGGGRNVMKLRSITPRVALKVEARTASSAIDRNRPRQWRPS